LCDQECFPSASLCVFCVSNGVRGLGRQVWQGGATNNAQQTNISHAPMKIQHPPLISLQPLTKREKATPTHKHRQTLPAPLSSSCTVRLGRIRGMSVLLPLIRVEGHHTGAITSAIHVPEHDALITTSEDKYGRDNPSTLSCDASRDTNLMISLTQ
jgi:hypothetical protein